MADPMAADVVETLVLPKNVNEPVVVPEGDTDLNGADSEVAEAI